MDVDYPDLNLGGWQGRVSDITKDEDDTTMIGIKWDSPTLDAMPKTYLEESARERLDWSAYYLKIDDVEPAKHRDSKSDVEQMVEKIEFRVDYLDLGEEGERIQAVLSTAKSRDEWSCFKAWSKHLQQKLQFPFNAVVDEHQEKSSLRAGDKLKVFGIEDEDELYGIIVECKQGRKRYYFPLCDLATQDSNSPNAKHLKDYRVWFANR